MFVIGQINSQGTSVCEHFHQQQKMSRPTTEYLLKCVYSCQNESLSAGIRCGRRELFSFTNVRNYLILYSRKGHNSDKKYGSAIFPWGIHIWKFITIACTVSSHDTTERDTKLLFRHTTMKVFMNLFFTFYIYEKGMDLKAQVSVHGHVVLWGLQTLIVALPGELFIGFLPEHTLRGGEPHLWPYWVAARVFKGMARFCFTMSLD